MLVNSIVFGAFFLIVLIPYFSILRKSSRWQNLWVLAASYFFYGSADWRMVPLLIGATVVFYLLGIASAPWTNGLTAGQSSLQSKAAEPSARVVDAHSKCLTAGEEQQSCDQSS